MLWSQRLSATLSVLVLLLAGCEVDSSSSSYLSQSDNEASEVSTSQPDGAFQLATTTAIRETGETITIASFNIQVFGKSKLKKPNVMEILADVVRRYDVIAIQELRASDQTIVPQFVELINSQGATYDYVVGPRLGRTSSKEQYVYLFDASRIEVDRSSIYTADDSDDFLHREPLVTTFTVRSTSSEEPFSFTLVNIHTDPDDTDIELDALDDVFLAVQRNGSGQDDVILLGDLNVDHRHLGELGELLDITWTVEGEKTNTRRTKSYDNIVFDERHTTEFTGRAGVLDLMSEYSLTEEQALDVSDHLPVWAEFSVEEKRSAVIATKNGGTTR